MKKVSSVVLWLERAQRAGASTDFDLIQNQHRTEHTENTENTEKVKSRRSGF